MVIKLKNRDFSQMKLNATVIIFIFFTLILISYSGISAEAYQKSDYELYYHKYVDSKESLDDLKQKDLGEWAKKVKEYFESKRMALMRSSECKTFSYGPHSLQSLDIYFKKQNELKPVIFFIHEGFGDKSTVIWAASEWLSLGYTVVAINYRFVPLFSFNAQVEDCASALKWVIEHIHQYGGDAGKMAITGLSCGSYMAALLVTGTRWQKKYNIDIRKVKCWFPMSGFYDLDLKENQLSPCLTPYMAPLQTSPKNDVSPVAQVTGNEPPSLIVHGSNDWCVPRTNAVSLYKKLKSKGSKTKLAILKTYMHANIFYTYSQPDSKVAELIKCFLAKYVPTPENN